MLKCHFVSAKVLITLLLSTIVSGCGVLGSSQKLPLDNLSPPLKEYQSMVVMGHFPEIGLLSKEADKSSEGTDNSSKKAGKSPEATGQSSTNADQSLPNVKLIIPYSVNSSIDSQCAVQGKDDAKGPKINTAAGLIPLVAALGQRIFAVQIDQQVRRIEAQKKLGNKSFSVNMLLDPAKLPATPCIVIARVPKIAQSQTISLVDPDYLAVLKLIKHSDTTMQLQPIFVAAKNTIAATQQTTAEQEAFIKTSITVAIRAIGTGASNLPTQVTTGAGTMSVGKLELSESMKQSDKLKVRCRDELCGKTELLPMTPKGQLMSLTFVVVEQGNLGFDADLAIAELNAIKAAFGPALSTGISTELKD